MKPDLITIGDLSEGEIFYRRIDCKEDCLVFSVTEHFVHFTYLNGHVLFGCEKSQLVYVVGKREKIGLNVKINY